MEMQNLREIDTRTWKAQPDLEKLKIDMKKYLDSMKTLLVDTPNKQIYDAMDRCLTSLP